MHIYFSGIGGAGIGPLALIARQAGYEVSGSDKISSQYTDYLQKNGIRLYIGQTKEQIAQEHTNNPIDWIVFSSAIFYTDPKHPELMFAKELGIKYSKRDECLSMLLKDNNLKLIAVAGTHGKTTTTSLAVWIFKELGIPVSYSVGAKIGLTNNHKIEPMGQFDPNAEYFVYECDEFDRNFLSFYPYLSIISVVDWDHHDIYPTKDSYKQAFRQFINQSNNTYMLDRDARYLDLSQSSSIFIYEHSDDKLQNIKLLGLHNRQNAFLTVNALAKALGIEQDVLIEIANRFPGSSRRFEQLAPNIYTDYAHTPEEISATMQLARELSDNVVVVYEPLTNRRQHYMKDLYNGVFESAKKVYWLPSYLAREDSNQKILSPETLITYLGNNTNAVADNMNDELIEKIKAHANSGDLVVCMAGGGGNSLDEWLRTKLSI